MTRVTNFGRKRTYLEAGFGITEDVAEQPEAKKISSTSEESRGELVGVQAPGNESPRKKKKTRRKAKADIIEAACSKAGGSESPAEGEDGNGEVGGREKVGSTPKKNLLKKEKKQRRERLVASEMRRQKRIQERMANVTCFACREKGHSAKGCPNVKVKNDGDGINKGGGVVGMCYRCGSRRHTLSRCKKLVDESNPLPFASCFVCNGRGHLASTCPQNQDRGIYPNGGCCKLCGEKTHLAKDCHLRKKDTVDTLAVYGTGGQPGADEDDFHTFKRRRQEVEKETKADEMKKKMRVKAATTAKPPGSALKSAKKVVYF